MEPKRKEALIWEQVRRHRFFLGLLGLALVIGALVFRQYGISWDEQGNAIQGKHALRAYVGGTRYFYDRSISDHGPAYFMFFSAVGDWVHKIEPAWPATDGRHLTNYVTFLFGLVSLYSLSLRFLRPSEAWFVPALLMAQPVIFGYGFVDQKDIPFMTSFTVVLLLGMTSADRLARRIEVPSQGAGGPTGARLGGTFRNLKRDLSGLDGSKRVGIVAATAIVFLVGFDLLVTGLIHQAASTLLTSAYKGQAPNPLQWLFSRVATDAHKTPLALYTQKLDVIFGLLRTSTMWVVPLMALFVPSALSPSFAKAWGLERAGLSDWMFWATGLAAGIAICIRQVGLFSLGLVGLYMLLKVRGRAIFPLVICTAVAAAITTLTWPYLWGNPLASFWANMIHVANFPGHPTWFMGLIYDSRDLPWTFFPVMAGIELTIPAVGLVMLGLFLIPWRAFRSADLPWGSTAVLVLWFVVPLALLFGSKFTIYGNIRHLLFVLPPLFVFAGLALDAILIRISAREIRAILVAAALLPGIVAILRLHPYEYIYYNALIGGPQGAYQEFEIDRWCLGTREAVAFLNQEAPQGASVIIPDNVDQAIEIARPDLRFTPDLSSHPEADYVLVCTYRADKPWHKDGYSNVFNVIRDNLNLTSVWEHQ